MADEIPSGWVATTLEEITRPGRSRVSPREHPKLPYIGLEHVESQSMRLLGQAMAADVRSSSILFEKGDVLYGKMRPYLNKVWVAEFAGLCSAEFLVFSQTAGLNSWFLALRLNADDFVHFANQQVSGERPRVNFKSLSSFPINLPPLPEQRRIVTALKDCLTRIYASEAAAQRGSERLVKYRAAVLHAAVTGALTLDWRNLHAQDETGTQVLQRISESRRAQWEETELQRIREKGKSPKNDEWKARYPEPTVLDSETLPALPNGWSWATLDQIAQEGRPIIYGIIKPGPHDPEGVPYVRVTEMKDGTIDPDSLKKTSPARAAKFARATLAGGDLLISKDGTIGRVAVVPPELAGGNITQHVMRAPIHETMSRDFVVWALRSDWCQQWLTGKTQGIALQGVNVADFRRLPVPIPPISEQREIVREVIRRLSATDRLAEALQKQSERAHATRRSLLHDAFLGNLVPQDAEDDSATTLLTHINETRATESHSPKSNRMPKPKQQIARRTLLDVLREHKKPITPEQLFLDAGFQPSQADLFYRELASLREIILERKPVPSESKSWPHHAHVLLELKENLLHEN